MWNLAKEGGWGKYRVESDKQSEKIIEIVKDDKISIEEAWIKFNKIHDKIKFRSFGKVTIGGKKNSKEHDGIKENIVDTSTEEQKAKELYDDQVRTVEN